jgi:hypothetical protein
MFDDHVIIDIPLPPTTQEYGMQDSYGTVNHIPLENFGETVLTPLGHVVLGRSGD